MRRLGKGIVVWTVVVLMAINTATACKWLRAKRAKHCCQPVACCEVSPLRCRAKKATAYSLRIRWAS